MNANMNTSMSANNALSLANSNVRGSQSLSSLSELSSMNMNTQNLESRLSSLNVANSQGINSNESAVNSNANTQNSVINPVFNITFNETPKNENDFMSMFRNAWERFQEQEMRLSFA